MEPRPDRPDPIALLEDQAAERVPELVPIRYGRMSGSPFAFYRGAAYVMASDLAGSAHTGIRVQLCGDAHLGNFGAFASPERQLLFDLNDFDETLPGPWEWDVKRLAASLAVASRETGMKTERRTAIVCQVVGEYRKAIRRFAGRPHEMIDWYRTVVGCEVLFQNQFGAWMSNDVANHRIALTAFPNFSDDPDKNAHTGLHHLAFEFDKFDDLNSAYLRLKEVGIVPDFCLDHGMTFLYYYGDPDGNHVELQIDNFGDWGKSSAWMHEGPEFHDDPIGKFVDPDSVAEARAGGEPFDQIHARAMNGEFARDTPPLELPTAQPTEA